MKRKILMILLIVSLAFNAGIISIAGYHKAVVKGRIMKGMSPLPFPGYMAKRFIRHELGLTKGQMLEIDKIIEDMKEENKSLGKNQKKELQKLFTMIKNEKTDERETEKTLNKLFLLQAKMAKTILTNFIEVRNKMTDEQKKKMDGLIERHLFSEHE